MIGMREALVMLLGAAEHQRDVRPGALPQLLAAIDVANEALNGTDVPPQDPDDDLIPCGGCVERFYMWRELLDHLDLVPHPTWPDAEFKLSRTHIGSEVERVWPCPADDCALVFFHDDPLTDHWFDAHEDLSAYADLLSDEDDCEGGYCSVPDPEDVSICMKHASAVYGGTD